MEETSVFSVVSEQMVSDVRFCAAGAVSMRNVSHYGLQTAPAQCVLRQCQHFSGCERDTVGKGGGAVGAKDRGVLTDLTCRKAYTKDNGTEFSARCLCNLSGKLTLESG